MANLLISNLQTYEAYWLAIATAHKEVDGFKFGDKQVVQNDSRSDMPVRVLWAVPYERSRYTDRFSDNIIKNKTGKVAYLKPSDSELFDDVHKCVQECEAVMEQVLTRVLKDKRGIDVEGVWTMVLIDVNGIQGSPIEMMLGSTQYYGWELEIPYMDNTNMAYDADKWN